MKILYVEDQLSRNIPRIVRLFSKYLKTKRCKTLENLENDESGYGAGPKEIKSIVEETYTVEVENRFPDALRKIIHHPEKYSLFIIDRNLAEEKYTFEEVSAIDSNYNELLYKNFVNREGDYLLQTLVYCGIDVMTNFYFLTANSAQYEIQSSEELQSHLNFKKFTIENFIEKGNEVDLARLQYVVNNLKSLSIQNKNGYYLKILRDWADEKTVERFIKILGEKDTQRGVMNNPNEIRMIYEKLLWEVSRRIPGMKKQCTDNHNNLILGQKTINWLFDNEYITVTLRNFFFSIKIITSELSHSNYESPTNDTINALVYMLKDMILWFDKICRTYPL